MTLYRQGKVLESLELWHAIYRLGPSRAVKAEALIMLADINAMFLDRKDRAISLYEKGIGLGGQANIIARAWYNLAMLRYDKGDYNGASLAFKGYLDRFPNGPKAGSSRHMLTRLQQDSRFGKKSVPTDSVTPKPIPRKEPFVRVALLHDREIRIFPPEDTVAGYGVKRARIMAGSIRVSEQGGRVALNGRALASEVSLIARSGLFEIGGAKYSGSISLHALEGKILVVNKLPLERYLEGVVPCEMPVSFKPEALRAQAIAARTHALYMLLRSKERAYDVWSTTASQVYGGASKVDPRTNAAIKATRGNILVYGSGIALAFYHSHSGGVLEDDSSVWDVNMPYYSAHADPVSNRVKKMTWRHSIKKSDVAQMLRSRGYPVSKVSSITVLQRSSSGRVLRVRIMTDKGGVEMTSNPFRLMIGATKMKSTLCNIGTSGNNITFHGVGYGHGVGMSQWGAEGMAREGAGFKQILAHYYPGTSIRTLY
ncbi:SpoIID/LytB domain-containing protein [Oleidesulfovibrio sp.]|uniref:SpoIID/LytB domain-containing protein n=1 Tax=Oleidesulfovibrio sp. TaxID=2909707 RepID=UPI003A8822DD